MIINWYTDPSGGDFAGNPDKFSSFYQYDPASKEFVRIRLELGRADADGTFARFKSERYVGFSDERYSTGNLNRWTVDGQGRICFDNAALQQTPREGYQVYDATNPRVFVHRGNPVTTEPNFPEGIQAKHLSLIANKVMITGQDVALTAGTDTAAQLSTRIKAVVAEIVGVDNFDDITDDDILNTLREQVRDIKAALQEDHESNIEDALDQIDEVIESINEQLSDGRLTPNPDVETAFDNFITAVDNARDALTDGENVGDAIAALDTARTELDTAINTLGDAQRAAWEDVLSDSTEAIEDAANAGEIWEEIENEYSELEDVQSIEEYEEIITETEVAG